MNEIEYIKVQIIKKRQEIDYYNNLNKNSSSTYLSEKDKHFINLLEKELHHLQQIKSILEAWEVVNIDFKICFDEEEEGYEGYFITGKDYYGKNSAIFSYIKSHYQIIKKALEKMEDE